MILNTLRTAWQTPNNSTWRLLAMLAAASLCLTLGVKNIGEEGVYTLSVYEMLHNHQYFATYLWGTFYSRPPLLNWLIIGLCYVIGFNKAILASRLITAAATLGSSLLLWRLCWDLSRNATYAWLAVCGFFSELVLFRLGWLAYADALMSFFILLAIYGLWLAFATQKARYFYVSAVAVFLGFLSKALTPYIFLGLALMVLLIRSKHRDAIVKNKHFYIAAILAWGLLAGYFLSFPNYFHKMWFTMLHGENGYNLLRSWALVPQYFQQILWVIPRRFLLATLPLGPLVLWQLWRTKSWRPKQLQEPALSAFWIFVLGFLPCWLSWNQWPEERYYLPVFPFLAMYMAAIIYQSRAMIQQLASRLLVIFISLKWLAGLIIFPGFYYLARPNYQHISQDMLHIAKQQPIYSKNGVASSLSLSDAINRQRYPKSIVTRYKPQQAHQGYVFAQMEKGHAAPTLPGCRLLKTYTARFTKRAFAFYKITS